MLRRDKIYRTVLIVGILCAFLFTRKSRADVLEQKESFFTDFRYDNLARTSVLATLKYISDHAYFYVDDNFWANLNQFYRNNLLDQISNLAGEFDNNIYPKETQFWGSEANPGIDKDPRITILLENLKKNSGGYFESANEYSSENFANSNEREMVVIDINSVGIGFINFFLAHEFQHLISVNQKELAQKIEEDVWLNELRSEYTSTVAGYNRLFTNSNLEFRKTMFLEDPSDSLTEWPNTLSDYGQVAIFAEYLAEHYSPQILSETLRSSYTGIQSIDNYLQSHNFKERFAQVFENWTVANYLNDTRLNNNFGYLAPELRDIHVSAPQTILYYPSSYYVNYLLKPWQGNWHNFRIESLPDTKSVKIDFTSDSLFRIVYVDNFGRVGVLDDKSGYIINDSSLQNFVLIPINESKTTDFGSNEDASLITLNINFIDTTSVKRQIQNGSLIKRPRESEIYVVEGEYKRYLKPEAVGFYGQLNISKVIEVDDKTFNSYITANYIREVNDKKIYAVWPDGTKHWLNMTSEYFTQSGRDWNSIFIINELEFNFYKTGLNIRK